jgi:hypothetical protein
MKLREEMVREVSRYLRHEFPDAQVANGQDARTGNEVFTIRDGGVLRRVEVTTLWFDQDDDVLLLPDALRAWAVADTIRNLPPDGSVRMATTGMEQLP